MGKKNKAGLTGIETVLSEKAGHKRIYTQKEPSRCPLSGESEGFLLLCDRYVQLLLLQYGAI